MTEDERQALREKHQPHATFPSQCDECSNTWPCDVIKVLDATENLKFNDLRVKVECDHWVTVKKSGQYGYASSVSLKYWTHTYCPKCGEKL